jgi:hypothetical protein
LARTPLLGVSRKQMKSLEIRPIEASFTPAAQRELRAFMLSVYRGTWGADLFPIISLAFAEIHTDPVTGKKSDDGAKFVLGAIALKSYANKQGLILPRLAELNGRKLLIQLPPGAEILDRLEFDWQNGRLVTLN